MKLFMQNIKLAGVTNTNRLGYGNSKHYSTGSGFVVKNGNSSFHCRNHNVNFQLVVHGLQCLYEDSSRNYKFRGTLRISHGRGKRTRKISSKNLSKICNKVAQQQGTVDTVMSTRCDGTHRFFCEFGHEICQNDLGKVQQIILNAYNCKVRLNTTDSFGLDWTDSYLLCSDCVIGHCNFTQRIYKICTACHRVNEVTCRNDCQGICPNDIFIYCGTT